MHFSQVIEGANTAGGVKVFKCKNFVKRQQSKKIKPEASEFVWDPTTRSHVKVLKRNK